MHQALGVAQKNEWVKQLQSAFLHCHLFFPVIGRMGSNVQCSFMNTARGLVDGSYNNNLLRDPLLGSLQELSRPNIDAWDRGRNESERLKGKVRIWK
jgi:hypothetical protein